MLMPANPETAEAFLREIASGPHAFSTLVVWCALGPYVQRDTGQITCSQPTLARTAGVAQSDVSRALDRLVEIGVLL